MIYSIKNNFLSVSVNSMGAELASVIAQGREYLWQKDKNVWYGQAPLLFPLVGPLNSKKIGGMESTMKDHGFLKETEFNLVSKTDTCLILDCKTSEKTLSLYPFKFRIEVKFELFEKSLKSYYTVYNMDDKKMVYSFGLHPAFQVDVVNDNLDNYYIEFDSEKTIDRCMFIGTEGVSLEETQRVIENDKKLYFSDKLFERTVIINNIDFNEVKFCNNKEKALFSFKFDGFKIFAMWQKPYSGYVCLEPWRGYNGLTPHTENAEENPTVDFLESGENKTYSMSIEF